METFFLGTHQPHWLGVTDVPLFVSRRTLAPRRSLPRARGPWALDSGGFSELTLYGAWQTTPRQYVAEVRRFRDEIGRLEWAASMDLMTESHMLKRTGLSIADHQQKTVENYLTLLNLAPELPWTPVLQGQTAGQYLDHADQYARAGIDLRSLPIVGIGSVCRRQSTNEIAPLVRTVAATGIRLHGFGVKSSGLRKIASQLVSADSMAWSFTARRQPVLLPGCTSHMNCANCIRFALQWREGVLLSVASEPTTWQLPMLLEASA